MTVRGVLMFQLLVLLNFGVVSWASSNVEEAKAKERKLNPRSCEPGCAWHGKTLRKEASLWEKRTLKLVDDLSGKNRKPAVVPIRYGDEVEMRQIGDREKFFNCDRRGFVVDFRSPGLPEYKVRLHTCSVPQSDWHTEPNFRRTGYNFEDQ